MTNFQIDALVSVLFDTYVIDSLWAATVGLHYLWFENRISLAIAGKL